MNHTPTITTQAELVRRATAWFAMEERRKERSRNESPYDLAVLDEEIAEQRRERAEQLKDYPKPRRPYSVDLGDPNVWQQPEPTSAFDGEML